MLAAAGEKFGDEKAVTVVGSLLASSTTIVKLHSMYLTESLDNV